MLNFPYQVAQVMDFKKGEDFEWILVDKNNTKKKIKTGKRFTLEDFRDQLNQMNSMGGIAGLMDKLPGMNQLPSGVASQVNEKEFIKLGAIIDSMTRKEKINPDIINGSRKKRIAGGSGTQIQDINKLLKQFKQMQKMMKKFSSKGGMAKMLRGMGGKMPDMPF